MENSKAERSERVLYLHIIIKCWLKVVGHGIWLGANDRSRIESKHRHLGAISSAQQLSPIRYALGITETPFCTLPLTLTMY